MVWRKERLGCKSVVTPSGRGCCADCQRKRKLAGNSARGRCTGKHKIAAGRLGGQWSGLMRRERRAIEGEGRAHTKFGAVAQRARQPFVRPNRMALLRTCDLTLSKMISIMDGQASGNPCQNIILQFARLERTDRTQDACTKALVTCGRRLRADASSS